MEKPGAGGGFVFRISLFRSSQNGLGASQECCFFIASSVFLSLKDSPPPSWSLVTLCFIRNQFSRFSRTKNGKENFSGTKSNLSLCEIRKHKLGAIQIEQLKQF